MQLKITRAVELARTGRSVRAIEWLTRVLGFETDSVPFSFNELGLVTAADYLARSKTTLAA